jgi:hypothetical protein
MESELMILVAGFLLGYWIDEITEPIYNLFNKGDDNEVTK